MTRLKRNRAQNVPGVPAAGQGLDDFTKSRMEQSRANATSQPPRPMMQNANATPQPQPPPPRPMMQNAMSTTPTPGGWGAMGGPAGAVGSMPMKKGGAVKMAKGGSVSSASKRADGCAMKGKTKGMMIKMKSGGMC